ncbi:MAG: hypothetical protein A3C93_02115 [Candidatus Lloydbacteria bacterium RIFCSPHIGHO2_02_FULL_54_17]|uniref:Phage shock protein A n=1 Tax=Candidatus Lloydbacteria bacterium RIFCSPHIGHO2_02_FULL_54_17 TaxID=1798664 RepID=A0A1G2DHW3_9BACT|nr:MAG: hypothetical protein A2762_05665 [Candidatus Lloydbacteria bacterium RIFCSPHIGHO2_01_FULL_54_11]OGZ13247.1 MAG: hypothetical protein A3C93_02115 [Candidatus Lloydbacteria bacterium RIFCSPHIGHO2_02_FULL_54_17]OGZ15377.1 MAG: hypothetical protein A2948_00130 [Candidatus Lloydbacteria bacterium RIFCSPLOWO2_01_FULL_54_18]
MGTATAFQKFRNLTLSTVHTVLDKAIDMNSIGALEQHVRDLTSARDTLDDQAAGFRNDVKMLPTAIAGLRHRHKEADDNINLFMSDDDESNNKYIPDLEAKLVSLEGQIAIKEGQLTDAQAQLAKFDEAVRKFSSVIAEKSGRIETLRAMEGATTAKEKAAKALAGISVGDAPNTDNVEARMQRKAAVADNRVEREMAAVTGALGTSSLDAEVAARIAKRKAALAEKKPS